MANPNRTDYEGEPLSGPGILWINSRITDPAMTPEAFTRWYEQIHIPDIIAAKPGGVVASWRYQALNPRSAPYLAVYKVPDMGFLQSAEFKAIPMVHPSLPGGGPIHRFAEFDARFLRLVESWSDGSTTGACSNCSVHASTDANPPARSPVLVSEAIEPANDAEFHEWYRGHVTTVSRLPGWRRTSRFELVFKKENKDDPNRGKAMTPRWLALHEFDDLPCLPNVPFPSDIAAFRLLGGFGLAEACWAEEERVLSG
jgi:hypothetical protein